MWKKDLLGNEKTSVPHTDIINGLKNKKLGDELLLPSVMLKHGEQTFLDDMTVEEVEKILKITIKIIASPDEFVKALINS